MNKKRGRKYDPEALCRGVRLPPVKREAREYLEQIVALYGGTIGGHASEAIETYHAAKIQEFNDEASRTQ